MDERSLERWLYGLAFGVARFLVVENGHGTPLRYETRRREAVLSLGDGPGYWAEQRSTQVRGPRRSKRSHGRTRRE